MKTFIIEWHSRTRNGERNHRRYVKTDDLAQTLIKMKLCTHGITGSGYYKGTFLSATEVVDVTTLGYKCQALNGGDYYFVRDGGLAQGTIKWDIWYDYSLKGWLR